MVDWRVEAGRKGGRSRSAKKLAAVRRNAKRAGRPPGVEALRPAVKAERVVQTTKANNSYVTLSSDAAVAIATKLLAAAANGHRARLWTWGKRDRARLYVDRLAPKRGGAK